MKTHFVEQATPYNGDALSNHWIYKNYGILGDAVTAFCGPCDVRADKMVDLEDVLNGDAIYSREMLHFIVEVFGISLKEGVLLQRLFSSILQQRINAHLPNTPIDRSGDDLFYAGTKKLSVSICTVSPTSILIHAGLNIDAMGAPVEAAGLSSDLGMDRAGIEALAQQCMRSLADEWNDIYRACCKVRAVS